MKVNGFFENDVKNADICEFLEPFLLGKKAEGRSPATGVFYRQKLNYWLGWLGEHEIEKLTELTPTVIRAFLMDYKIEHNQGGVHSIYRVIKVFLNWLWYEYDIEWGNPIAKVKCEMNQIAPIEGVQSEHVNALFESAKKGIMPERDCAIIAVLLDTGIRRSSLAGIRCGDVNLVEGSVFIRHVKAGKQYTVYLGKTARNYVRKYAKTLPAGLRMEDYFWRTKSGEACNVDCFYSILVRIEDRAGIPRYSLHDFRRFFALESYRNGADIYEVAQMLGHTGISVTERYLAVDEKDRRQMHNRISPLDKK